MELCCCSLPSPHDGEPVTTKYPGRRPRTYYKTAGNALSASPQARNSYVVTGEGANNCQNINNKPGYGMTAEQRIGDYSHIEALAPANAALFSQCLDKPSPPTNQQSQFSRIDNVQQRPHHTTQQQQQQQQPSRFHNDFNKMNNYNNNSIEKRLLVQVPPGTASGTTLHVGIPNEPGRLLSVQVPVGNYPEFYVTYKAQPNSASYQQPSMINNNNNNNNNGRPTTNTGNNWILPAAGGLATGLASVMLFDHFAES
jgi:hypothetical protein